MTTAIASLKSNVDVLFQKQRGLIQTMSPTLIEGTGYVVLIKGRASAKTMPTQAQEVEHAESDTDISAEPSTEKQRKYLHSLAMDNLDDGPEKTEYLANIETLSRGDASEAIKGLIALSGR